METLHVRLPYDPTGHSPDNLQSAVPYTLTAPPGFAYKIITLLDGGFYLKGLKVYDDSYNLLIKNRDYIVTYYFKTFSQSVGLDVCAAIVFLDKSRVGNVYVTAQLVGGDRAFSMSVINDYVMFYNTQPAGYIPRSLDYAGNEPVWEPGELDQERWRLDTYQPFNNEIYYLSRAVAGAVGNNEVEFREHLKAELAKFLAKFDDVLERHEADHANPHVDTKAQIDLAVIQNLPLATEAQARAGTSNVHYLTPKLSYATVDQLAIKPRDQHINDTNNPHKVTASQIGSLTRTAANNMAGNKYGRNDVVANANYITAAATIKILQFKAYCDPSRNSGVAGAGNCAYYETFSNNPIVVTAGDTLQFTQETFGPDPRAGIDARVRGGRYTAMRLYVDAGVRIVDQYGVSVHPGAVNPSAAGKWETRIVSLDPLIGVIMDQWRVCMEGDVQGYYTANFKDVYVKDKFGNIKSTLFNGTLQVPSVVGADDGNTGAYSQISKTVIDQPGDGSTTGKTLSDMYAAGRSNLPAQAFIYGGVAGSDGYLNPNLMGYGYGPVPWNKALRSDSQWVDWDNVMAAAGYIRRDSVTAMSFMSMSAPMARSFATSLDSSMTAPSGSTLVISSQLDPMSDPTTTVLVKTDNDWQAI